MEKAKITALFEYRKIPKLMEYVPKKRRKKLYKELIKLQAAIYELDTYLESNWKLKKRDLIHYWTQINTRLHKMAIPYKEAFQLTQNIRRYQLHETQLRENKLPTRLKPEYYYYYKSCDVRLMRNLIYREAPELLKLHSIADWRYYDLITEVNDDIEDFSEDLDTINGNMFLIKTYQDGIKDSTLFFDSFLDEIAVKSENRFKEKEIKSLSDIHKWTMKDYERTKNLLKKQKKSIKKKGISNKKLLIKKLNKLNTI